MFKKNTLENGLRIITVPMKNTETVTVLVSVGTGSKYEKKEINGISHFLEHMYFKGTKKRPSTLAIAEVLDRIGGAYNAFTAEEYTGYFAKVTANYLDLALDWVSDIFLNSTLPEKEIGKEKGVIIEEINMRYDHPMAYVQNLWMELLYGDQPAGWDIAGTKESVTNINREKLNDYMKKQYVASNTTICLAGKINEKSAIQKVKKYFSKIKIGKPIKKLPVLEKQTEPDCLLFSKETDQTHLLLGARGYSLFHPKRYVMELLGVILGGMMSSRLFEKIRTKLGIAYYINCSSNLDPDTGYLVTSAGIDNKNLEKGILAVLKEYKRISKEKVSESELKKAKDNIKGRLVLALESSDFQASFYAGQEILENKINTPEDMIKKIDRIKSSDVLKVAKDIFEPQKLNLALIGPFKDKNKFKKLLKI